MDLDPYMTRREALRSIRRVTYVFVDVIATEHNTFLVPISKAEARRLVAEVFHHRLEHEAILKAVVNVDGDLIIG